jgi:hypothetical protein
MIKASLATMVLGGLFEYTKNVYTIAPVSSFKGNKEQKEQKTFTRGSKKRSVKNILIDALKKGEYTCQELRDIVLSELPDREADKTLKTVTGCVYSHIPKTGHNVVKNGKKFSIK